MHKIQEFFKDIIHATTMMVENNKDKKRQDKFIFVQIWC